MKFTKMHGLGNDYVYVDCTEKTLEHPEQVAIVVSDRHFGIGSDGLILIEPSEKADFFMSMYNADGSRGEMCGNGIRCVAKYVYDNGLTDKTRISIDTLVGIKYIDVSVENGKVVSATVDMGEPILKPEMIPVVSDSDIFVNEQVEANDTVYHMTCVSMGNPHGVIFADDVMNLPLEKIGPALEHHPIFPKRANIEFVEVMDEKTVRMRVWERGSGETMACGTGSCATVVACALNHVTGDEVTVKLLGGDLQIRWNREDNHVYMTGPATTVFEGNIDL
ncbi:MAG: diaminopimelate epimerase [Lachnospiraceae bacterium]